MVSGLPSLDTVVCVTPEPDDATPARRGKQGGPKTGRGQSPTKKPARPSGAKSGAAARKTGGAGSAGKGGAKTPKKPASAPKAESPKAELAKADSEAAEVVEDQAPPETEAPEADAPGEETAQEQAAPADALGEEATEAEPEREPQPEPEPEPQAEEQKPTGPSFRISFSPISRPSLGRFSETRPSVSEVAERVQAKTAATEAVAPESETLAEVPEAEPEAEAPEPETATEPEAQADAESEQGHEPDAKAESEPEPEAKPEPEAEPGPEEKREPEPGPEEKREPEPEREPAHVAQPDDRPAARTLSRVARVSLSTAPKALASDVALSVRNLTKRFGRVTAVDSADLEVKTGSFYGFVGPNGAGKTTTLSMVTGLLRPDSGIVKVYGADVWRNAAVAKRMLGVLPDHLRLFDRLTGAEYLHHAAALRGLDRETTLRRVGDLVTAFGLEHSLHRFVSDYSAGMVKKIAIAAAMIHSPRLLVLDEPFESVDPVSAQLVIDILTKFTEAGGTVLLSSHSMHLIQRICDSVAIIVDGRILASGTLEDVLGGKSLEDRFVELAGGASAVEGMEWLHSYSD